MREIKFRAWNGKEMISPVEMSNDQLTLDVNGRGFVNVNSASTKLSEFYTHMTPMQYTGLKDKNGVEIYEGDIVKGDYVHEVAWHDGAFWLVRESSNTLMSSFYRMQGAPNYNFEVVGSIYENPGLADQANQGLLPKGGE